MAAVSDREAPQLHLGQSDTDITHRSSTSGNEGSPASRRDNAGSSSPLPHARSTSNPARKRTPEDFVFGRVLGEGSYSTVLYAKESGTRREFAVKVLDKRHIIKEKKVKYVNIEKDVLNRLSHPFIIKLFYTFQDMHSLYFVLELAKDGDLLGYIRKLGSFEVEGARFYIAEIITGVMYLHNMDVIHRDLKPENILLDEKMHVKITDFGTAKPLNDTKTDDAEQARDETSARNSFVGTAEYCSPELLNDRAASKASDIWAIGCILYHLLAGKPPFKGANEYQTFQKIIKLEYSFPDGFPDSARDLVSRILVLDPCKRPTLEEIQKHPFFDGFDWENLHEKPAPNLRPFLPATSHHNMEDLTSDMEGLATGTGQFHGDIDAAIRDPFEEMPVVPEAEIAGNPDRSKKLEEQASSPIRRIISHTELIIMNGTVYKRKGLFSKKRGLVLTDLPRLQFFDEGKLIAKSEIPWSEKLKVELKGTRHFFVHTPKRTYYLEALKGDAQRWVDAINTLLQSV
ncbi:AGC/PDK1 protein kinase [Spizellomyces punctatus DAOM BR117]|uniref:non-specific serine/threonine protein kinase n=1 Tax=Spizellomyces punctatus (strain DAOM BR117) TaxID=645134 RepID=A0A0L0H669_SPIPD|nr:AGC/PDK1 protein kinase [Spizellomyces punctatus DAOM BR117]KNC96469.1 AGC/PDK1 protein kinase [Spizellomyces punctatus DAOM BR117]|eukprot:XP_016604509.1 AGC/PDK1 protein kinase [Spizellomyces punctatus DAOM BR117]